MTTQISAIVQSLAALLVAVNQLWQVLHGQTMDPIHLVTAAGLGASAVGHFSTASKSK